MNLLGVNSYQDDDNGVFGKALRALYLKSNGNSLTQTNNYCLTALLPKQNSGATQNYDFDSVDGTGTGGASANQIPEHIDTIPGGANGFSYCVAQFFVYYAQDMDK